MNIWPKHVVVILLPLLAAGTSLSETINIPAVEISSLHHNFWYDSFDDMTVVSDTVTFPSGPGGFSGPGFSASVGDGDRVVVRFEAPSGKKFKVTKHPDATSNIFFFGAYWATGAGDSGSYASTGTVTFENLSGSALTEKWTQFMVFNTGQVIKVEGQFDVGGDCEFSAVEIELSVSQPLADAMRTYGNVNSFMSPSFGVSASSGYHGGSIGDQTVMAIVSLRPTTCDEVKQQGYRLPQDLNGDCHVNLEDLGIFVSAWLRCNDPVDSSCSPNWP